MSTVTSTGSLPDAIESLLPSTFGGRLRSKAPILDWHQALTLVHDRWAFVYQRLSTTEQIKHSLYSLQMQDALEDLAITDGYVPDFGPDDRRRIREAPSYLGWYRNGAIVVEQRDLGISGTKGLEERPGLEHLIALIETKRIETIYVVHISRLFRDQTLINAFSFGELCKKHDVKLITPYMRLNLRIPMHMEWYRREADWAAKELENIINRLHGARNMKARQGRCAGAGIPPGYVVDTQPKVVIDGVEVENPNYEKLRIYEPHAHVVRMIMARLAIPNTSYTQVVRSCRDNGIRFEPFPPDLAQNKTNSKAFIRRPADPDGGWPVSRPVVISVATNPSYLGWWIWGGEVISTDNHAPIIDEATFERVQANIGNRTCYPKKAGPPLPLAGLVWCGDHEQPRKMFYSRREKRDYSRYRCEDVLTCGPCCSVSAHVLDDAVADFVLAQFSRPELAAAVLAQLERNYDVAHERASAVQRDLARLDEEIATLEHNYRVIKLTPERAAKLEADIAILIAEKRRLADLDAYPIGKVAQMVNRDELGFARTVLTDLRQVWSDQPDELRNALLQMILDRVIIYRQPTVIRAVIRWQTGSEHVINIRRPFIDIRKSWTDEEDDILRRYYGQDPRILLEKLPGRAWNGIQRRASALGVAKGERTGGTGRKGLPLYRWKADEDEIVRKVWCNEMHMPEAVERLDRSEDSLRARAKVLGLKMVKLPQWELIETRTIGTSEGQCW